MPIDITMPKWGMSMQQGHLVEWLVSSGDAVTAGQVLATVETEKVDAEVESPEDGVIELVADAGTDVQVGDVIARLT